MNSLEVLKDLAARPGQAADYFWDDLDPAALGAHPGGHPNSVAWLIWHAARETDAQIAPLAGVEQVWTAQGFDRRFDLGDADLGYEDEGSMEEMDDFAPVLDVDGGDLEVVTLPAAVLAEGVSVQQMLVQSGLVGSGKEAKRLIAERTPEEIAAALVRLLRKEQPAPEELSDPGSDRGPAKRDRMVRNDDGTAAQPWPGGRLGADDVVWFRLDVGRNKNADPKWLIPLICRIGGVAKQQIGSIRTFPEETRFEVALTHAGADMSPAELAAALAGLRRDPTMRAELGRAGRRAAEDRHDWSLVVARILDTVPAPRTSLADDLWGRTA